jgi:hypothetical protein
MTRAIIGWPVYTHLATVDGWGGSWLPAYPVTNLNRLPVRQVARSTDVAPTSTRFRVTLPETLPVRLLTFVYHNAMNSTRFRVRAFSDLAETNLRWDSGPGSQGNGTPFWTRVDRTRDLAWLDKRWWSGTPGALEKALKRPLRPVVMDKSYPVRVVTVEIADALNPAGFCQLGYFDVSDGLELPVNPDYGAEFGVVDRTRRVEADGGGQSAEELPNPSFFNGTVPYMPEVTARAKIGRFLAERRTNRPFVWLPNPDDSKTWLDTAFLAFNDRLDARKAAALGHDSVSLSFKEVI